MRALRTINVILLPDYHCSKPRGQPDLKEKALFDANFWRRWKENLRTGY